jgi:hypothetical protein
VVDTIDELRRGFGGSPVTLDGLEARLGADGVRDLRREYFPRWRPSRAYAAAESLRGFKEIVVEDEFERELVRALAPRELTVEVRIAEPELIS